MTKPKPSPFTKRLPAPTDKEVLAEIIEAAKLFDMKPSSLGMMALQNAYVASRLKRGGSLTLATLHRLREALDQEHHRRSKKARKAA
jgi:hypothetical protein